MLALILLLSLPVHSHTLDLYVDCTDPTAEHSSLHSAQAAIRAHYQGLSLAARPSVTVHVTGPCLTSSQPLVLGEADSGPVTWQPAAPLTRFAVSGGQPVTADQLTPITDEAVLAQFPAASRPYLVQLNLTAAGLDPGPAPIAGRQCRSYAEGLPQPHPGGMPDAAVNSPTGLEFFAASAAPMRLACYPNQPALPFQWSQVLHSTTQGPFNRTMGPDLPTLARAAAWQQQYREDPGSIYVHQYNRVGWADMHWRLEGLTAHNMTFGGCGNMSIGEHLILTGNYFYSYNVAAELDVEGEYYINRTSGMLYAWLPGATPLPTTTTTTSSNASVVGWVSLQEAPVLDLNSTAGGSWVNVSLLYGRGIGLNCGRCSGVTLVNAELAYLGLMGANVTEGSGVRLQGTSLHDTGNGGVYLYAGDRSTLTPAGHVLANSTLTRYNRYTHCYTPGVVLGGVGNTVAGTRVHDAPHQAFFLSGNEHTIEDCDISHVTQITSDSGAFYFGRDLSYRGNRLLRNAWHDINSCNLGTPILYADDCASSIAVINNTFRNCSGPAAASEGGKGHVFSGNYVGEDALGVHAVGKNCAGALQYLSEVPWNTSAAWLAAYPEMVAELAENSGAPWHLVYEGNTRCAPRANSSSAAGAAFTDMSIKGTLQYNGSNDGGVNACWQGEGRPTPPTVAQPARGWNSWTSYGCGVTEADVRETADLLVAKGLAAAGYTIVAPDDCWAASRSPNGTILPDNSTFPSGMAALGAYIRSQGLTFGVYSAIGNQTCAHRPGSAGHEALDAATYISWGVTWLKLDNCDYPNWDPATLYGAWSEALNAQPYRLALAVKAVVNYSTALAVGAASRRVGGDVSASWGDLLGLAYMAEPLWQQARAGSYASGTSSFWTDVELVQVGNGDLTPGQQRAHFYLWCAMHAPLMLSTKIAGLSPAQLALLTNPETLAINHDAAGAQAHRLGYQRIAASTPKPPLTPMAFGCSLQSSPAPSQGQAWALVPTPTPTSPTFQLQLQLNTSLCLLRPSCNGSSSSGVVLAPCGQGCDGGTGSLWQWAAGGGGGVESLGGGGGQCLTMEPRVHTSKCVPGGTAYQSLTFIPATGQLAMNFTGSGAAGDYTGYPQCLDVLLGMSGELWGSGLSDGSMAVVALNPSGQGVQMSIDAATLAAALGLRNAGDFKKLKAVRDVGERLSLSNASSTFEVAVNATDAAFLRITPS